MSHSIPYPRNDFVHVWLSRVIELADPESAAVAMSVLASDEQIHAARFKFESDRLAFIASRSLRRHVLSHYEEFAPSDWQFAANRFGQPRIAQPPSRPLQFNTSKSGQLVVCAVTSAPAIGVDIECLGRSVTQGAVASALADCEMSALQALHADKRAKRFFAYWTLKEAYLKARGTGMSIALNKISFTVADETERTGHLTQKPVDDNGEWVFALISPIADYLVAVCVPRLADQGMDIVPRWTSVTQVPH